MFKSPDFDRHTVAGKSWTRRRFVGALGKSAVLTAGLSALPWSAIAGKQSARIRPQLKKIAIIATEVRKHSHAQHFIDRFLEGYGWQGRHYHPKLQISALYVDQFPKNDLSRDRAQRHHVKIFPTIAEALTLGGSKLAVDGVVIIGEHGNYPKNAKGQTLYPRYNFFKQVVKVFEQNGRSVPVFNDKHLSTDWNEAVEMVADAKRLGFAFLAGSSLPLTWRIPSIEMPLDTPLIESVCAGYGGVDSYDFHGLETAQCMSERRAGGEVGVKSVCALKGDNVWERLAEREQTQKLLFAALARSHTCRAPAGYTVPVPSLDWLRKASPNVVAYFIEHLDGFKTTLFMLNELLQDFNYAGLVKPAGEIISCQMHLPMPPRLSTTADFFNPLVNNIEQTILSGKATYPVERTLLTSGMTLFAVESLYRGQELVETPQMKIAYRASANSTFWRA